MPFNIIQAQVAAMPGISHELLLADGRGAIRGER